MSTFHRAAVAVCVAASSLVLSSPLVLAADHATVTPYDALRSRLTLKAGQTYLSFMKTQVKPALDSFEETIQNDPATKSHNYGGLQTDLIQQGAGVAVRIDAQNYIFNIGYLDGSDPENDVKSGRSYGVGPTGHESDPSDLAYLTELQAYFKSEPAATGAFVKALMLVLTDCDASGWAQLSPAGQAVATDFLAIYTAESDRHIMVDLKPSAHPWEIDLAAATFVSVFDAETGMIMQDGKLVQGTITQWWAKGKSGSGIGETRRDRLALQKLIASRSGDSPEVSEIAPLIDASASSANADLIQDVLEFLSSTATPETMGGDADRLAELMSEYLVGVRAQAKVIAGE